MSQDPTVSAGASGRWAWLRADPWLAGALAVTLVAVVVPLWASRLLPMMDLPQHLATVRILHSFGDPAFGVDRWHVIDLSGTQYLAYYLLVDALTYVLPLEVANRAVLSLYALGLPLSLLAYLRAFGRDPGLALLAAPLAYNTFLFMGFANYVTAIPLLFWALALLKRVLDDFRWPRLAGLAAVTLLLFYSHAQAFVLYGLLAGLTVLLGGQGWHPRHWWKPALHIAPALLLMGVWMSRSLILAGRDEWQKGHGGRNVTDTRVNFEPLLDRVSAVPHQLLNGYRDDADEKVLFAWLALLVLAVALGLGKAGEPPEEKPSLHASLRARLPAILAVVGLATYLLSPISYKWIWPISHRLVPVVALLGLGAVGYRRLPGRPALLLIPATALMIWASTIHVARARAFSDEAGPIREVVARIPTGQRLMTLVFDAGSAVVQHAPFLHIGQYYVVDRGGMATFSFANFPQSPVLYPTVGGPPTLPPRWEWTPDRFQWQGLGDWYDWFLVRGGPPNPLQDAGDRVELVHQQGPYRLYRRK